MYIPSEKYKLASQNLSRNPKSKIKIDGVEYTGMDVIKVHPFISQEATKMIGEFPTKQCRITIFNRDNSIDVVDKEIEVYRGLVLDDNTIEYIPQGIFKPKADDIKTNSTARTIEITMKDKSVEFDDIYGGIDNITYPTTLGNFINEIVTRHGMILETPTFVFHDLVLEERPNFDLQSTTERTLIAAAGALSGSTTQISRTGGVVISKPILTDQTIKKINYKRLSSKEKQYGPINSVVLGNKGINNDIVKKDEESISTVGLFDYKLYDNPYVDLNKEDMIDSIASEIIGMIIIPFELVDVIDHYLYDINDQIVIEDKEGNLFTTTILKIESSSRIFTKLGASVQNNSQTDYNLAGSSKKSIEQIKFDVNHVKQEISAVAKKTDENSSQIAKLEIKSEGIDLAVETAQEAYDKVEVYNPVLESTGNGQLSLPDCAGEKLLEFTVDGKSEQETSTEGINKYDDSVIIGTTLPTSAGLMSSGFPIKNSLKDNTDYYIALFIDETLWPNNRIEMQFYNNEGTLLSKTATKSGAINHANLSTATYIRIYINESGVNELGGKNITGLVVSENITESYTEFVPNSPSPDYPSEIKSIDGVENLFDINTTATPDYIVDGKVNIPILTYTPAIFYIKLKANQQYTISFKNNNASSTYPIRFQIKTTDVNQNVISTIVNDTITSTKYERTLTFSTDYIRIEFFRSIETNEITIIDEIQLEKGPKAHDYVPYGSNYLIEKVVGKNKFNKNGNIAKNKNLDADGNISDNTGLFVGLDYIPVKPNAKYTISTSTSGYKRIGQYDSDYNFISRLLSEANDVSYTFITSSTCRYIRIACSITDLDSIQIEEDSQATENEEYKEAISLIDLKGNKLCSNKDLTVRDLLTVKNGLANIDKKINEIILDGTEDWQYHTSNNFAFVNVENLKNGYNEVLAISDKLKGVEKNAFANNDNIIFSWDSANLLCIKSTSNISDIATTKTWLSNNPVTVYYVLNTPEIIDLGEVSIETVQSDCTLTLEEELDTNMYAKYIKNNPYNEVYPTKAEANALIELTAEQILNSVSSVETLTKNNYVELSEKFDGYTPSSQTAELQKSVEKIQTDTYTKTEINTKLTDGSVTKVQTTSGTFDENGMTYEKTNAPTKTTINEVGVGTKKSNADEYVLFAGYVDDNNTQYEKYKGQTIVASENMLVKHYLVMGSNSRIEDYEDGTGIFYLG